MIRGFAISDMLHFFACLEAGAVPVVLFVPSSIAMPTTIIPMANPIINETMSIIHPSFDYRYLISLI
jgi:hypothetical protein